MARPWRRSLARLKLPTHMLDTAISLLLISTCAYALALAGTLQRLLKNREPARNLNFFLILSGWLLHSGGLWLRGMEAGSCPIRNPFEVLQFVSWSIILVYLFTGKVFRLSLFGTGSASLAAILSLAAFVGTDSSRFPSYSRLGANPWIETHAALALFSYGVFGLLAVVSALFLLQNRSLKHKRPIAAFRFLPSIVEMEMVLERLLWVASGLFSFSLAIGLGYWLFGSDFSGASFKLSFSVVLWITTLVLLVLQLSGKLYGKRLAIGCILLFIFALFILWPVESDREQRNAAIPAPLTCPYVCV